GEDRRPGRVQLAHELVQRDPALRVETGGRLVEEQHRRSVHDRAGDHQPLRHAARERIDGTAPDVGERDLLEQGVGLAGGVGGADAEEAPVEDEVLAHAEAAVEGVVLGDDADELPRQGGPRDDVDLGHPRPTGRRQHPGRQHAGRRRLARAVRAEQAEDLTAPDYEVEAVDRGDAARIHLRQALGANGVLAGGSCRHNLGLDCLVQNVRLSSTPSSIEPRMTTTTAREHGRLDKRNAIVGAAKRVFLRHGYTDASVDAIAAEAGVSKQTIYNHFGDKEQLFRTVIQTAQTDAEAEARGAVVDDPGLTLLEEFLGESEDLDRDLRTFAQRSARFALREDIAALRRLVIAEAPHHPELLAAGGRRRPRLR